MGAKRQSYTPKFRAAAARLVIDTVRTIAEVGGRSGSERPCWVAGRRPSGRRWTPPPRHWTPMSVPS